MKVDDAGKCPLRVGSSSSFGLNQSFWFIIKFYCVIIFTIFKSAVSLKEGNRSKGLGVVFDIFCWSGAYK